MSVQDEIISDFLLGLCDKDPNGEISVDRKRAQELRAKGFMVGLDITNPATIRAVMQTAESFRLMMDKERGDGQAHAQGDEEYLSESKPTSGVDGDSRILDRHVECVLRD